MDFSKILNDNTMVICNSSIKRKILDYLNTIPNLYSINFMSMNEVKKHLFFDYDKKTIHYLMNKNMPYEVAEVLIKNMYYVEDMEYECTKLKELVKYKKELEDNNLLIKDPLFLNYIKNKDIVIINKSLTSYDKYIISILEKYTKVGIYEYDYKNYDHDICEFKTIDDEVEYVAYSICELIDKGIDINTIKISNIDEDYINSIKRIFGYFNIPINLPSNSYLIGTNVSAKFLDNYSSDIAETIESIKEYDGEDVYNKIIDICNKYTFIDDYMDVKDMIIHDLSNTLIPSKKYKNAVEIIDYKDAVDDDYVFLMNFNLKSIPKVYKDEDYITDNIKPDYLDKTIDKNKLEKEITIKNIANVKNMVITYKLITPTSEFYPSILVDKEPKRPNIDIYKSYSKVNDKLKLESSIERLVKYGNKDNYLNALVYNYGKLNGKYDNRYKKVSTDKLYKILNNKLTLSYTSMQKYYECPFKYYISNVLKLDVYEEKFGAILGSIFHHILEVGIDKNIDIDSEIDKFIHENYSDRVFSKKETFFIENAKGNIRLVLDIIRAQMAKCKLDVIKTEQKVPIDKSRNIKITFTGTIDKLLYKEYGDKTIVAIIDYKTSNSVDINLNYINEGLGLQLPVYLLLAKNLKLNNVKYAGMYLQKVMPSIENLEDIKKKGKADKLKLEGYSNMDESIIGELDITYADSSVIKSLGKTKGGVFNHHSKILSDSDFEDLVKLTNDKIEECITDIVDAEFNISPVKIEGTDTIKGCEYCNFKDICFRTNNDIKTIKKESTGGDEDE